MPKRDQRTIHPDLTGWRRYVADPKVRRLYTTKSMLARGRMAAGGSAVDLRAAGSRADQTRAWRPTQYRRGARRRQYLYALTCVTLPTPVESLDQTFLVENARRHLAKWNWGR